eukprot:m.234535 g.234535  ORF g.234535 m.234535 type:complete len:1391 (-) comp15258_c1_seq3:1546-5718(-)
MRLQVMILTMAMCHLATAAVSLRIVVEPDFVRAQLQHDLPMITASMETTLINDVSLSLLAPTDIPEHQADHDSDTYSFDVTVSDIWGQLCLAQFGHVPIAHWQLPTMNPAMDSVAFVTLQDAPWTSIESIGGAKIAISRANTSTTSTWLLASHVLEQHGMTIWDNFEQAMEVASDVEAMRMLQLGKLDVVVLRSGVLEALVLDRVVTMKTIRVLDEQTDLAPWQPAHKRSTVFLPGLGVMMSPHVDSKVAVAFASALLQLNASHSNATTRWTQPLSLLRSHHLFAINEPFHETHEENQCLHDREPETLTPCPGIFEATPTPTCDDLTCMDGATCYCFECLRHHPFEVFVTEPRGINQSVHENCHRAGPCLNVTQGSPILFEINAHEASYDGQTAEVRFLSLLDSNHTQQGGGTMLDLMARTTIAPRYPGSILITVQMNGMHVEQSPFLMEVRALPCERNNEFMSNEGVCECVEGTTRVAGMCISRGQLFARFVLPSLLVVTLLVYVVLKRRSLQNDSSWKIEESSLLFPELNDELGITRYGPILRATYNGADVACEPIGSHSASSSSKSYSSKGGTSLGDAVSNASRSTRNTIFSFSGSFGNIYRGQSAMYGKMRQAATTRHPNLAAILGICFSPGQYPMLVTRIYENGNLYSLIHSDQLLVDDMMLSIVKDVVSGMFYLHSHVPAIIHGHLNSKNVHVDANFSAKIANYHGLSKPHAVHVEDFAYYSPERLNDGKKSTADDVYAFAILASECLTLRAPYEEEEMDEVLEEVANLELRVPRRPEIEHGKCDQTLLTLLEQCWAPRALHRPTFASISIRFRTIKGLGASYLTRQDEGQRQARVLNEVFPDHVAEALKAGEKVEPQEKECVTLFYSDIVGYTKISSGLTPAQVSDMLDRLYTEFDRLCEKYNLFKVETIGDAYVCAGNVQQVEQPNHTALVCRFAMDASLAATKVFIDRNNPDLGTLTIRCGIHAGPVVASVVGAKNPRYCLFGETVAMTECMESTSEANYVQLSEDAAECLVRQDKKLSEQLQTRGMRLLPQNVYRETFFLLRQGQIRNDTMSVASHNLRKGSGSTGILTRGITSSGGSNLRHSTVAKRGLVRSQTSGSTRTLQGGSESSLVQLRSATSLHGMQDSAADAEQGSHIAHSTPNSEGSVSSRVIDLVFPVPTQRRTTQGDRRSEARSALASQALRLLDERSPIEMQVTPTSPRSLTKDHTRLSPMTNVLSTTWAGHEADETSKIYGHNDTTGKLSTTLPPMGGMVTVAGPGITSESIEKHTQQSFRRSPLPFSSAIHSDFESQSDTGSEGSHVQAESPVAEASVDLAVDLVQLQGTAVKESAHEVSHVHWKPGAPQSFIGHSYETDSQGGSQANNSDSGDGFSSQVGGGSFMV